MVDLKTKFVETMYKRYKFKIEKWEPNKSNYPDYMFLGGDRGILAYIYLLDDDKIPINEIVKKVSLAESELDRPVFFINNYHDLNCLYFETNEQIKDILFNGYSGNYYHPEINTAGDFENLINIFKDLKINSVKFN